MSAVQRGVSSLSVGREGVKGGDQEGRSSGDNAQDRRDQAQDNRPEGGAEGGPVDSEPQRSNKQDVRESPRDGSNAGDQRSASEPPQEPSGSSTAAHTPSAQLTNSVLRSLTGGLRWLLRAGFYIVLFAAALYLLWRYNEEFRIAWRRLLEQLRRLWERWFGGRGDREAGQPEREASTSLAPPRPFADFADPFRSGSAEQREPEELVRYSFEALEAWARERGCPREAEQTALEFASHLGRLHAPLRATPKTWRCSTARSPTPPAVCRLQALCTCNDCGGNWPNPPSPPHPSDLVTRNS